MSYEEKKSTTTTTEPMEEEVLGLDEPDDATLTLRFPNLGGFEVEMPRDAIGLSNFLVAALENEDAGDFTLDLNLGLKNGKEDTLEKAKNAIRGVVHWMKTYKNYVGKEKEITPAKPYTREKTPSMIVLPNGEKLDETFLKFFSNESKVIDENGIYDEENIDMPFGIFMTEVALGIYFAQHLCLVSGLEVLASFVALAAKGKYKEEQVEMFAKHFSNGEKSITRSVM